MNVKPAHILCIDDDADSCEILRLLFHYADKPYSFSSVETPSKALKLIEDHPFDLYILDYMFSEMTGVKLCEKIREHDTETPIIFFSGMGRGIDRESAIIAGANDYLLKPKGLDVIVERTELFLRKYDRSKKI